MYSNLWMMTILLFVLFMGVSWCLWPSCGAAEPSTGAGGRGGLRPGLGPYLLPGAPAGSMVISAAKKPELHSFDNRDVCTLMWLCPLCKACHMSCFNAWSCPCFTWVNYICLFLSARSFQLLSTISPHPCRLLGLGLWLWRECGLSVALVWDPVISHVLCCFTIIMLSSFCCKWYRANL